MSNIFNDRTDTELNERTINFQNLSVLDNTIPILGVGNVVSGQVAGIAGLDLISKDTLDEIKDDVLEARLKNLSNATITTESVATINGDVVGSVPILQGGKDILNQTSISAIRTLLLENTEEAIVIKPTDTNTEINFHTNIGVPPAEPDGTNLRMSITDTSTFIINTLDTKDIKVDNAKKIISNNYAYRDDITDPIYLTFDNQHAHFTPPNGLRLNNQFQIDSANGASAAHLFTSAANKPIHYTTRGTGNHVFYTNGDADGENATEILNIKPDGIECSKIIKAIGSLGDKIHWDTTSKVYTSPGELHYYTGDRQVYIWAKGQYVMLLTDVLISLTRPVNITGSCTATSFIGDLTGNAQTATKIATITNSNIVQLDDTQTLTNKTITGQFTGPLTGNAETSTKIASITNSNIVQLDDTQTLTNKTITGQFTGPLTGNVVGNLSGNVVGATLNMTGKIETDDHMSSRYYRSIYFDTGLEERFNEIEMFKFAGFPSPADIMNFTFDKTESTSGTTLLSIDNIASQITAYCDFVGANDIRTGVLKALDNGQTYQTSILMNSNSIDFWTDGLVSSDTQGTNRFSISATGSGELMIRNYIQTKFYDNILLNTSTDLATTQVPFNRGYITNLYPSIIDFPETLSDKIKLYGDLYKLTVSNNSLDYTTGNTHTFYQSTNKLLTLDNTETVSYRKFEAHNTNGGVVACATDGANVVAMRYNSGLGCEFAGVFGFNTYITSQANLYLNPAVGSLVVCNKQLIPASNGGFDLGASGNRWGTVYAATAEIDTSDRTKKKEIDYDIDNYANELLNLKPCSYKMIDGTSNRKHLGLISQDLEEESDIFRNTGAFIKSPKTKTITEYKSIDGGKTQTPVDKTVVVEGEFDYGLRYAELISPLIRLCQKQQEQINQLLARVDLLESGTGNELSFI